MVGCNDRKTKVFECVFHQVEWNMLKNLKYRGRSTIGIISLLPFIPIYLFICLSNDIHTWRWSLSFLHQLTIDTIQFIESWSNWWRQFMWLRILIYIYCGLFSINPCGSPAFLKAMLAPKKEKNLPYDTREKRIKRKKSIPAFMAIWTTQSQQQHRIVRPIFASPNNIKLFYIS